MINLYEHLIKNHVNKIGGDLDKKVKLYIHNKEKFGAILIKECNDTDIILRADNWAPSVEDTLLNTVQTSLDENNIVLLFIYGIGSIKHMGVCPIKDENELNEKYTFKEYIPLKKFTYDYFKQNNLLG